VKDSEELEKGYPSQEEKGITEEEHFFDDLAKGLDDGSISRGRALKLVGALLLGSALMPFFPRQAQAITRKKCRKRGGVYLTTGECHCASPCTGPYFHCGSSTSNCSCYGTVEGTGFCGGVIGSDYGCTSSSQCSQIGWKCVIRYGCSDAGQSCTTHQDCHNIKPYLACVNGICQSTNCGNPCPK
jgi:hypothetical protein